MRVLIIHLYIVNVLKNNVNSSTGLIGASHLCAQTYALRRQARIGTAQSQRPYSSRVDYVVNVRCEYIKNVISIDYVAQYILLRRGTYTGILAEHILEFLRNIYWNSCGTYIDIRAEHILVLLRNIYWCSCGTYTDTLATYTANLATYTGRVCKEASP